MARYQRLIRGGAKFCSHSCAAKANAVFGATGDARRFAGGKKRGVPESTKEERIKAKTKIQWLVESGAIKKPDYCEKCKKPGDVDGHHHDYSKPSEVVWLCRSCHMKEHYRLGTPNSRETPALG